MMTRRSSTAPSAISFPLLLLLLMLACAARTSTTEPLVVSGQLQIMQYRYVACVNKSDVLDDNVIANNEFVTDKRDDVPPPSTTTGAIPAACAQVCIAASATVSSSSSSNGKEPTSKVLYFSSTPSYPCICLSELYAQMVNGHVTRGKSLNVDEQTCQEKNPNDAVALYTAWMETPPPPPPELFSIEEIIIAADSGQRYISDLINSFISDGGATNLPELLSTWIYAPPDTRVAPWWEQFGITFNSPSPSPPPPPPPSPPPPPLPSYSRSRSFPPRLPMLPFPPAF